MMRCITQTDTFCYFRESTPVFDIELLGGFGGFVVRAHRYLILTRMFIVSIIVVIFGAARWVRGENQSLKVARGVWILVSGGHAKDPPKHNTVETRFFDYFGTYPPV
jgi:hypothetical protein